jgi:hypothetical protein
VAILPLSLNYRLRTAIMKKSYTPFVVFLVLLAFGAANPLYCASKKKLSPTPSKQPVIASVSANSITVTEQKGTKTFTITQFTEINVNGQKATVADLKPGMTVTVTIGIDPSRASRVNASGAPSQ